MPKIIIWDNNNFLISELEGKTENLGNIRVARFRDYKLIKSQTIKKQLKKIEAVIKYSNKEITKESR